MKRLFFILSIVSCLVTTPLGIYAQSSLKNEAASIVDENQKDKLRFAYGFYKTYMNSLIYQLSDLPTVIAKKYVSAKVLKKTVETGADVLLDAQDCIEENVHTLQIVPLKNDWFCVSFLWTSAYDKVPSQKKVIYIKVKEYKKSFVIDDAASEKPELTD